MSFESLANSMMVGLAVIDADGLLTFANFQLEQILACTVEDLTGQGWIDVLGERNAEELSMVVDQPEVGHLRHPDVEITFDVPGVEGGDRLVRARSWPVYNDQDFLCRMAVFMDVSDRSDELRRKQVTDELIGTFMESVNDAVLVMDESGRIESASHSVESVFGWPCWSVLGASIKMLLNPIDPRGDVEYFDRLLSRRAAVGSGVPINTSGRHRDGSIIPLELRVVRNSSTSPTTYVAIVHDLREIESLSARLDHAARTDGLTGLLSQRSFMSDLRALVQHADRPWSLVKVDLARFRYVNQAHGFGVGDDLLRSVARDLRRLVPDGPVGRVGGDRFALVAETCKIDEVVWDLRSRIEGRGRAGGISHPLRINVGVAHFTGRETAEDLMQASDAATRVAKQRTEGLYQTFDAELSSSVDDETELVGELHGALSARELATFFQPEVDLRDSRVIAHEALVRWHHPERGLLGPDEFLPLATAEGLMPSLGVQVLAASLDFVRQAERIGHSGRVWVNLSAGQLFDDSVLRYAKAAIDFGVDPERLGFELTEHDALAVATVAADNLASLVDLGVGLAIDDFGTGYSTLSQLRTVPADLVKLDRSFLVDIHTNPKQRDFVGACVNLAHTLDMNVVVEGIETRADAILMAEMGCDSGQGFWFGRPAPADEALTAL